MDEQDGAGPSISFGLSEALAVARVHWRSMAITFGVVVFVAVLLGLVTAPEYRAVSTLQLTMPEGRDIGPDADDGGTSATWSVFQQTQVEVMETIGLIDETYQRYVEAGFGDDLLVTDADDLQDRLTVTPRLNSELIDITVDHEDAERAAALANLHADVYREHNLDATRDAAREARKWLEDQIDKLQRHVAELSGELLAYQADNNVPDADQEVSIAAARVEALKGRLADVAADRAVLESRVSAHEALAKVGAFEDLAKHMDTPLVRQLYDQFGEAKSEYVSTRVRYGEKHPAIVSLQAKLDLVLDELKNEVLRSIDAENAALAVLGSNEERLATDVRRGNDELLARQARMDGYERLRSDAERSKAYLTKLSQRKDELDLIAQTQLNNVRTVERARVPSTPFKPNIWFNLAFGSIIGIAAAAVVALAREYLDDRVIVPQDMAGYLGVPYLGHVPAIPADASELPALYTHEHPHTVAAEAVRAMRTQIEQSGRGEPPRRILVSSALPGEGKTDTVVRLGIAFAQGGRRVLIIDADLQSPRQHRAFGVADRSPGLVDALQGAAVVDVVRETPVPGLSLMTAGAGGLLVKELLGSDRMAACLDEADDAFDLVILDSPPILLTADPAILARYVEAMIVVVRWRAAPRTVVRQAITTLRKVNAPIVGAFLNATSGRAFARDTYYSSGYGYGYGYARPDDDPDDAKTAAK